MILFLWKVQIIYIITKLLGLYFIRVVKYMFNSSVFTSNIFRVFILFGGKQAKYMDFRGKKSGGRNACKFLPIFFIRTFVSRLVRGSFHLFLNEYWDFLGVKSAGAQDQSSQLLLVMQYQNIWIISSTSSITFYALYVNAIISHLTYAHLQWHKKKSLR